MILDRFHVQFYNFEDCVDAPYVSPKGLNPEVTLRDARQFAEQVF